MSMLEARLRGAFPHLILAGIESPPFRALTVEEDEDTVARMNSSGAGFVFVGLGCPKHERWMAEHSGRINAVTVGVGAAFDFHAGTARRAPKWMQAIGLEWFFRFLQEPRRMFRRYFVEDLAFISMLAKEFMRR